MTSRFYQSIEQWQKESHKSQHFRMPHIYPHQVLLQDQIPRPAFELEIQLV
jgi:hypothetical protein